MKTPQKAIILAAGLGTRMFPLSLDTPKPMMPLWDKPIIGHILDMLVRWGVREVLINLHFHPSPICDYFKKHPTDVRIAFSFEPEVLGTGGVLRRAGWFLDQKPFWMINADIAADLNPQPLLGELESKKNLAVLWMEPQRGPRTVEIKNGNIVNFQSSRPGTAGTYTFCGLQLVSPALLQFIPNESFSGIIGVYQKALKSGWRIRGVCVPESYWSDLGTPESYLKAHAELRERYQRQASAKWIPVERHCVALLPHAPSTTLRAGGRHYKQTYPNITDALHRQDEYISKLKKKDVVIRGFASIAETAVIKPGARIENAVIWRNAVIGPKAVIQNAIVGSACEINGQVRRLAVKPFLHEAHPDLQLNAALASLKLEASKTTIMPFEPRGSARSFTRLAGKGNSFIMIRYSRERHENCLYAQHGRFFAKLGLNAPEIIVDCPEKQFVVIQDLGDKSLQKIAAESSPGKLIKYYCRVLQAIIILHQNGAKRAQKERLAMVAPFSPDLYQWEREFFGRHFLATHLGLKPSEIKRIMTELAGVGQALNREPLALIHRDLQSTNIIFFKNMPFFIDFQGMRLGAVAYDLASLLCDPYTSLNLSEQELLLDFYNNLAGGRRPIPTRIFWLAGVQRLCQALGAYGLLGAGAETKWFAQYIPPALRMLRRALEQAKGSGYLPALIKKACDQITGQ